MMMPQDDERHTALASRMRRDVLAALSQATHPLDATAIAERFGIHVTTARFHLEQLELAGLVRRDVQHAGRRGRPRIAFSAVHTPRDDDALRQLNSVLVEALEHDADGGRERARKAGERWSESYREELAETEGDEIAPVMKIFTQLGFAPTVREKEGERAIDLLGCPFRDIAAEHPGVVCSAHRGLLEGTLASIGREPTDATLQPFVEPQLCVVKLRGALAAG